MEKNKPTPTAAATTNFILAVFRLNNLLLRSGDRLVESLRLTSARWQILGAIAYAERAQPVAWLARDLGANRQNVQRIVNDLESAGLVAFETNPHHRRAQLVVLTDKGRRTFESAMRLQVPWVESLCESLALKDVEIANRVVGVLRQKLDREEDSEE